MPSLASTNLFAQRCELGGQEAHTGFEPVLREDGDDAPLGRESEARPASELPADLQRIVERLGKSVVTICRRTIQRDGLDLV